MSPLSHAGAGHAARCPQPGGGSGGGLSCLCKVSWGGGTVPKGSLRLGSWEVGADSPDPPVEGRGTVSAPSSQWKPRGSVCLSGTLSVGEGRMAVPPTRRCHEAEAQMRRCRTGQCLFSHRSLWFGPRRAVPGVSLLGSWLFGGRVVPHPWGPSGAWPALALPRHLAGSWAGLFFPRCSSPLPAGALEAVGPASSPQAEARSCCQGDGSCSCGRAHLHAAGPRAD